MIDGKFDLMEEEGGGGKENQQVEEKGGKLDLNETKSERALKNGRQPRNPAQEGPTR